MSELNIHQRLHAVMKDVDYVQKEDKKVNNQYTFVSHDAVTAKIRPALLKHGVVCYFSDLTQCINGNRTEAQVVVRFVNIDKPEDFVDVHTYGYGIDPQDKGPGKAMSYAMKYALLKTFSLETGDDVEKSNIDYKENPKASAKPPLKKSDVLKHGLPTWLETIAKRDGKCDFCNKPIKSGETYLHHKGERKSLHPNCKDEMELFPAAY